MSREIVISTIGDLIDRGYTLTACCRCGHSAKIDLEAVARKKGPDSSFGGPNFRVRCSKCGTLTSETRLSPPNVPTPTKNGWT